MKFQLEFSIENDAFQGEEARDAEIARILREVAQKIEFQMHGGHVVVRDANGNYIGDANIVRS